MCATFICILHVPATAPGGYLLASWGCLVAAYLRLDFCITVGHLESAGRARASTGSCADGRPQECSMTCYRCRFARFMLLLCISLPQGTHVSVSMAAGMCRASQQH